MPSRKFTLGVGLLLTSADKRTIEGTAIPADETVDLGLSKPVGFAPDSITFDRENVPLLAYHDPTRPVGRLSSYEWTDQGMQVAFKVSATRAGDDVLTLAQDQVLGLSIGIDVPDDSNIEELDDRFLVHNANCFEISVTPSPAFSKANIHKVSLSKAVTMPDAEEQITLADGDVTVNTNDTFGAVSQQVSDSMAAGTTPPVTNSAATESHTMSQPTPQPVPRAVVKAERHADPYPHLRGGNSRGFSFFRDMALQRGLLLPTARDAGYAERLNDSLRFAVTTADIAPAEPQADASLTNEPTDPGNPLTGIITTRSLPAGGGDPFYVLSRTNTGEGTLSAPHVEGVEPALGDIGSWTRQLVEPSAVSGKVAITREAVLANTSPDMESLVFNRMNVARKTAIETHVGNSLKNVTLPAGQVKSAGGSNVGDELTAISLDLLYTVDGARFTTAIVNRQMFGDLVNAKGGDGRPLFPIQGATNTNGSTAPGLRFVNVGGVNYYPVAGLQDGGYLLDPSCVISWLGPVMEFNFDYEVSWVRLGHFQSQAFAVTDTSGIIRLTYSAT